MRRAGFVLALALSAGCVPETQPLRDPELDRARFQRIGILPFSDARGQGRAIAREVERALGLLDVNLVDQVQLDLIFSELGLDRSGGLSKQSLREVRRATYADALLFGSAHSSSDRRGWTGVSLLLVDTVGGRVLVDANLRPHDSGGYKDLEAVGAAVVEAVAGPLGRGPSTLPQPQDLPAPE